MSDLVIKVENLSKQYRLGTVGTGSFAHDVNRIWYRVRGKEDPYLRIGEVNQRDKASDSEYVWALTDVNFEVNQGDVLGIIGRNGAGKSTLLKILSRTTAPTKGSIKIKGRIASLLEVGTGFHPELTGRENIFLNGAILGMTKKEIRSKFDEIVDFAGVERYIDTPVKRYSSGMYVRLAFGVAAHLEPEILVVDEVLAVGDAEFQKKALGKMKDVSSNQGRTVLFVSHNMSAVQNLCTKGLLMNHGTVTVGGEIQTVIRHYQELNESTAGSWDNLIRKGSGKCMVTGLAIETEEGQELQRFRLGDFISIKIDLENTTGRVLNKCRIIIGVYNLTGEGIMRFDTEATDSNFDLHAGKINILCRLNEHLNIKPDIYFLNIAVLAGDEMQDHLEKVLKFEVENFDYYGTGRTVDAPELSKVFIKHQWSEIHR